MKYLKQYIYVAIILIVSIPLIFLSYKYTDDTKALTFTLSLDKGNTYSVKAFNSDNSLYLFVPGFVSMDSVRLSSDQLVIDGAEFAFGDAISEVSLNERHEIIYRKKKYDFYILQGSEISSLFINTATGSMNEVYSDKNHKEAISIMAYDKEGRLNYTDKSAHIKGRGNTTWEWGNKRPFNLIFDKEVPLLGLSKGTRVALLANSADITNTKNKIALQFSEQLGLEWTPSSEYVELYINNEYHGLYLACDKVEVSTDKLNLNKDSDYLLQATSRTEAGETMLYTESGKSFLINWGNTDSSSVQHVSDVLNNIESSILNGSIPEQLDMESFAKKYFLEEIMCNTDIQSYYFYIKNGKLLSGPAWDYDLAAKQTVYKTIYSHRRFPWYNNLFKNGEMTAYLIRAYNSSIKSQAEDLLTNLEELEHFINKSNEMNLKRWSKIYKTRQLKDEYQIVNDNYHAHLNYMNTILLEKFDGYILRIINEGDDVDYLYFSDKNGVLLLPEDCPVITSKDSQWINAEDGSLFDLSLPLTKDVSIYKYNP